MAGTCRLSRAAAQRCTSRSPWAAGSSAVATTSAIQGGSDAKVRCQRWTAPMVAGYASEVLTQRTSVAGCGSNRGSVWGPTTSVGWSVWARTLRARCRSEGRVKGCRPVEPITRSAGAWEARWSTIAAAMWLARSVVRVGVSRSSRWARCSGRRLGCSSSSVATVSSSQLPTAAPSAAAIGIAGALSPLISMATTMRSYFGAALTSSPCALVPQPRPNVPFLGARSPRWCRKPMFGSDGRWMHVALRGSSLSHSPAWSGGKVFAPSTRPLVCATFHGPAIEASS